MKESADSSIARAEGNDVATFSARKSISIYWTIIVVNDIDVTKDRTLKGADAAMEPAAATARTKMVASVARQALPSRKTHKKREKKKEKKRIEQINNVDNLHTDNVQQRNSEDNNNDVIITTITTIIIIIIIILLLLITITIMNYCASHRVHI